MRDIVVDERIDKNVEVYLILKSIGLTLEEIKWLETVHLYQSEPVKENDKVSPVAP